MAATPNYFNTGFVPSASVTMGAIVKESGHVSGSNVPAGATATATSDKFLGVADNTYASGEYAAAINGGTVDFAIAGETLTPGTSYHLTTDGQGRVVAAAAGVAEVKCIGFFVAGFRTDGTAHVGEQCRINVNIHTLPATA